MLFFGDSIAYGYGASSPACDLAGLLTSQGVSVSRQGIMPTSPSSRPGNMACDLGTAMYGNPIDPTGIVVQCGTNDAIVKGTAGIGNYLAAMQALAVWSTCAVKLPQSSPGFTFTGPWAGNTYWPGAPGKYTTQVSASVSFTLSGSTIYLGSYAETNITGFWMVYVDGQPHGPFTCGKPNIATAHGQTFAPQLISIAGLSAGPHSVVMTFNNATGNNPVMYLDFAAGSDDASWRPVYFMAIPPQITTYQQGGQAIVDAFNAALEGMVSELWADGLNVQLCRPAYNTATDFLVGPNLGDDLHPNDSGYYRAFQALYRLIR